MEEENMDEELTESKETTEDQDGPFTDADIKELQKKAAKADEYYEQLLRTKADLENFRKRTAREREEIIQRANETLLRELFVVLDHFDLGLQTARTSES